MDRSEASPRESYRRSLIGAKYRLTETLPYAREWQERIRTQLLLENANTAFGVQHGFAGIRSMNDYRDAVPLRAYTDYEPWMRRTSNGEQGVLTAQDPRVFFTTSGSTGTRKQIPVTERFLTETYLPYFRAAMGVAAEYYPETFMQSDATLNLRHDRLSKPATTASGRPSLGPSQIDMHRSFGVPLHEPGADAPWANLPVPVDDQAYLDKLYIRVRMAVEHDVRCIIGHNPTMIAILPELLTQWWPQLLRDVRDGTYLGMPGGDPNPRRATELERQAEYFGRPTPGVIWPRIRLLYCWTSGVASLYLPRLRELYGSAVTVLPTPITASEGPVGVPIDRHPTAGPLAVSTALYEFVDADDDVRPHSDTMLFHELEPGRNYHVVFSHAGGLYRYVLGDLVHVVDRVHGVPRVEYAGRNTLVDAVGERLREYHLVRALQATSLTTGLDIVNATSRIELSKEGYCYEFALALRIEPSAGETGTFERQLDQELRQLAPRYHNARLHGALKAPRVRLLPADRFVKHWLRKIDEGMRPPEVKDQIFQPDPAAWQRLVQ